mgnify:CR=1 FL=1
MKRAFVVLFSVAAFAAAANAQRFGNSTCGLTPGPCMERHARQGYAPVDYYLNNGYGYGYGGYGYYGTGRSAIIGGVAGAITGGLVAAAVSHRSGDRVVYAATPDGGQYYAEPQRRQVAFAATKPQKPLDCRKKQNRATCEAMAREQEAAARQEAERQALSASPWRLYNRSGFTVEVFDGDRPLGRMRVNQSWRVLEPASGFRAVILAPDFSGTLTGHEARIRPSSDFQGWVITSPRVEE